MTGKLRDTVDILWPATKVDRYTEAPVSDWDAAPARTLVGVRANVQPAASTEAAVTAETVVTRWNCWLPPDTDVDTVCRVRWDGDVYTIDGDVERWKTGRRIRRLHMLLKRVT